MKMCQLNDLTFLPSYERLKCLGNEKVLSGNEKFPLAVDKSECEKVQLSIFLADMYFKN